MLNAASFYNQTKRNIFYIIKKLLKLLTTYHYTFLQFNPSFKKFYKNILYSKVQIINF